MIGMAIGVAFTVVDTSGSRHPKKQSPLFCAIFSYQTDPKFIYYGLHVLYLLLFLMFFKHDNRHCFTKYLLKKKKYTFYEHDFFP